jgi:hypothetical protein
MRLARYVACVGVEEGCIQDFGREGDHLEDLSLDGKMILKWFLNQLVGNSCEGEVEAFVKAAMKLCVP